MKTNLLPLFAAFLFASATFALGATNDLSGALQKGLFEEEANHNLEAAAQAYQSVAAQFDKDRKLAATAIFRLGEVYRKQGKTNEANAQYERIMREFSDQTPLVELSRNNLPKVEVANGGGGSGGTLKAFSSQSAEDQEIAHIKTMIKDSPDLINALRQGVAPLHSAAATGQLRVAEFLLANGADVNRRHDQNKTPLYLAAENGHRAMVELLIANGANVNGNDFGQTALHIASALGFKAVAQVLLENQADVDAKNRAGSTPLHLAVVEGHQAVAELLLENGANINAQDNDERTPLLVAVAAKNVEMVKFLIEKKADVNAAGKRGWPPLIESVLQGRPAIIKLLLKAGANTEVEVPFTTHEEVRQKSFTALDIAVDKQEKEIVDLLLESGANPNSTNEFGSTPLHFATTGSDAEIVKSLLAHGAKVNARNRYDNTPLHWAVGHAQKEIVQLLLDAGVDVNAKTSEGSTPLHIAIKNGQEEIAMLLLKHKANPNAVNNEQETPLSIARGQIAPAPQRRGLPPPPSLNSPVDPAVLKKIGYLLIKYGADENYERRTQIAVTRDFKQVYPIFHKGTNSWNRFSLLEVLGMAYSSPSTGFPFPNLSKIVIHRLKGKEEREVPADLEAILKSDDCSKDIWLEWGDVIEIPEKDHKVDEQWSGYPKELLEILPKCLARDISITVKGETKLITFAPKSTTVSAPEIRGGSRESLYLRGITFWLNDVVSDSGLLRTSSDKTRVKVTRINPVTKKSEEQIFNLEKPDPQNQLWLRDGDQIEIPEKP